MKIDRRRTVRKNQGSFAPARGLTAKEFYEKCCKEFGKIPGRGAVCFQNNVGMRRISRPVIKLVPSQDGNESIAVAKFIATQY